jgi:hypothetical protein
MCGVIMSATGCYLPEDRDGCVLPKGHDGPHLCNTNSGPYGWETDWDCDCEHCKACGGDYCIVYWPASERPQLPRADERDPFQEDR